MLEKNKAGKENKEGDTRMKNESCHRRYHWKSNSKERCEGGEGVRSSYTCREYSRDNKEHDTMCLECHHKSFDFTLSE